MVELGNSIKKLIRRSGFQVARFNSQSERFRMLVGDQNSLETVEEQIRCDALLRDFFRYLLANWNTRNSSRLLTDRVAHYFLGDNKFFVEVGAWDPIHHSDTYWLEKFQGWNGIQVEPNPVYVSRLREERASIVIAAAVAPLAAQDKQHYLHGRDDQAFISTKKSDCQIDVVNLREILSQSSEHVHALFIDIEGHEVPVLQEITSSESNIPFVSIETIWNHREIVTIMDSLGYQEIWRFLSGFNSWFLKREILQEKTVQIL